MTPVKFLGKTQAEARAKAEAELGQDLTIVATRSIRKEGIAGMLGGGGVEITVLAPAKEPAKTILPQTRDASRPFAPRVYDRETPKVTSSDPLASLRAEVRTEIRAMKTAIAKPAESPTELLEEVAAMRKLIEMMTTAEDSKKGPYASLFRSTGIEGIAAQAVSKAIPMKTDEDSSASEIFRDALADVVRVTSSPISNNKKKVVSLVGPSGVGKTTTAAKLAAHASMELDMSVLLVTCDTFRVGAVEQLQRYADLMDVDFAVASSSEELSRIIGSSTADFVVVDTSGQFDGKINATEVSLKDAPLGGRERHVLLCMPAQIRMVDAAKVVRRFKAVKATALCITKLDETTAPAGIVHGAVAADLPLSVLCFGPRVPEDIGHATTGAVLEQLVPNKKAGVKKAS